MNKTLEAMIISWREILQSAISMDAANKAQMPWSNPSLALEIENIMIRIS